MKKSLQLLHDDELYVKLIEEKVSNLEGYIYSNKLDYLTGKMHKAKEVIQ